MKKVNYGFFFITALMLIIGCGKSDKQTSEDAGLTGTVKVDGSSTVFLITEAVAEEFGKVYSQVRVTVGISGTGGGFKKLTAGEIDITNASRPIKLEEIQKGKENKVDFIELPVAFDGLSVVVNKGNSWVDYLTTEELHRLWKPGSTVFTWQDIRPDWPKKPINLYGPGTDSGTFDYFTEAINGKSQECRSDFSKSEDDNVLVQGISGDINSLGFFGYAYYKENTDKLKVVPIDNGGGPGVPSKETINNGTYEPLSRPLFVYVNLESVNRPEVEAFIKFYLKNGGKLAGEVGYVSLPEDAYSLVLKRFEQRITGSAFSGRKTVGLKIVDVLSGI